MMLIQRSIDRYHSVYRHRNTPSSRYMYHCAQIQSRQKKSKKSCAEGVKHRDKDHMDTFTCGGWIHITVMDDGNDAFVKLDHKDKHVSYWNIDVPHDVRKFVVENAELTPTQVSCSKYFFMS